MTRIFDEHNARHGVPVSYLNERCDDFERPSGAWPSDPRTGPVSVDEVAESERCESWMGGACCGDHGGGGECMAMRVRMLRRYALISCGFSHRQLTDAPSLCEYRREFWDAIEVPDDMRSEAAKAIVTRTWAERFINEYGATTNDYGNDGDENSGHVDAGEVAGDGDRV